MNTRYIPSLLILTLLLLFNFTTTHGPNIKDEEIQVNALSSFLINKIQHFSKLQQANIGAFIISTATLPIFALVIIFNIRSLKILDVMSSFAAGALIGDVFIHNLPEIFEEHHHKHKSHHSHKKSSLLSFLLKNEILICMGVIVLFTIEKFMILYSNSEKKRNEVHKDDKKKTEEHSHVHVHSNNIAISILGDFIHNVTDGMAIGAGFNISCKLGVTLSVSIFFHEIPHEVGDFSYLLKQNMKIGSVLGSQLFSAIGAFIGVYLSFYLGQKYSPQIISFASGAFLYLAINTIMGDLKTTKSIFNIIFEFIAFILGVILLMEAL